MSFNYTAAYSSRITKSKTKNPLKQSTSSPLASRSRKPLKSTKTQNPEEEHKYGAERLGDCGIVRSLTTEYSAIAIPQQIIRIQSEMFEDIPDRAGMNSTRIAEVLNYRKNLPPIITVAHVHAISRAPTATEREIAQSIHQNTLRRISIPGRGTGSTAVGDSLILVEQWAHIVEHNGDLDEDLIKKYIDILKTHPSTTGVRGSQFEIHETVALLRAGLLTSATQSSANLSTLLSSDTSSTGTLASLSTVGSRAASGSLAAVGGTNAIHDAGGGGAGSLSGSDKSRGLYGAEYTLSVPSMGLYMKLLESARTHLVSLVSKSKYKETPKYLLKELWDGGVSNEIKSLKNGPLSGALPGRTKKWKQFYGLSFSWILAECLGSGLVEIFDTGSVGHGIRLT